MVVDAYAWSAEASRVVQAPLPISAAIVTQFVTHFGGPGKGSGVRTQGRGFTRVVMVRDAGSL